MPLYTVQCAVCKKTDSIFRKIIERDINLPRCCSKPMERKITAPLINDDIEPYISMIDGSIINSRSQHRNHLKSHQCIEVGNETKHLKAKEKVDLSGIKKTVIEVVNSKL